MKYRDLDRKLGRKRTPFCHPLDGSRPCLPIGQSSFARNKSSTMNINTVAGRSVLQTRVHELGRENTERYISSYIHYNFIAGWKKWRALFCTSFIFTSNSDAFVWKRFKTRARTKWRNKYIYIYKVKISSVISSIFLCVKRVLQSRLEFLSMIFRKRITIRKVASLVQFKFCWELFNFRREN